jgi:hypothetical protein
LDRLVHQEHLANKDNMRTGKLKYNILRPKAENIIVTVSDSSFTVNSSYVTLVADTIQIRAIHGGVTGQLLTITNISGGSTTIAGAVSLGPDDNINLVGWQTSTNNCVLNSSQSIILIYDGTKWLEVGRRSDAGAQGVQGIGGVQGGVGSIGTQGTQGVVGPDGQQGAEGFAGDLGSQGSQGNQGANGDIGFQGLTGMTGTAGLAGTQGTQGSQGAQGDIGAMGIQGVQGAQGT